MANEKLKITKVDFGSGELGLYVEDDRVFYGAAEVDEVVLDQLAEGILQAVGQKYDVVIKSIDGTAYNEVRMDFIPESLRDMKAALRDIERGTYKSEDDEDSEED